MNINQWIDGLSEAGPPTESNAYVRRPRTDFDRPVRKRIQSSPKSSMLMPFFGHSATKVPSEKSLHRSRSEPSHACSAPLSASSSSIFSSGSQDFRRRPRRATKKEKYIPKSRDRATRKDSCEKKQKKKRKDPAKSSKRKRRKDNHAIGIVENFHTRSVPKSRLTVIYQTRLKNVTKFWP